MIPDGALVLLDTDADFTPLDEDFLNLILIDLDTGHSVS